MGNEVEINLEISTREWADGGVAGKLPDLPLSVFTAGAEAAALRGLGCALGWLSESGEVSYRGRCQVRQSDNFELSCRCNVPECRFAHLTTCLGHDNCRKTDTSSSVYFPVKQVAAMRGFVCRMVLPERGDRL